jgi:oligoendopeptidase F
MFANLTSNISDYLHWEWADIEPYAKELEERPIDAGNVDQWLADWSKITRIVQETNSRLYVATTLDTTDEQAVSRYHHHLEFVIPPVMAAEQKLKEKLLASGLEPDGFEIPLRNMRVQAEIFREENLPLFTELGKLGTEYDKIIGAQTVEWAGKEMTLAQMRPIFQDADRPTREQIWRQSANRRLADRAALNELWTKFLRLRRQIAANAGFADFRAYQWRAFGRFDYSPEDCENFQRAIEQVVVPAANRIYDKMRQRLGVSSVRPWDVEADVFSLGNSALRPFEDAETLIDTTARIFNRVDPQLGSFFGTMRRESLLDLANRKGKAPGGYCTSFPYSKRPFIFMNAVGLHDDVQTLLHEGGHAFHAFESSAQPYIQQEDVPIEFAEVASMSMELLAQPYLTKDQGGFYAKEEASLATIEHLERLILFWPYMAVVDAFQHWIYTHADAAENPDNCDEMWTEIWDRFIPGVDFSGLDDVKETGWHRKLHIFQIPFYYVEYGLAQLGAVQVWGNSLTNQAKSVADYRKALALGGTVTLPELFATAGARFAMDPATMQTAVDLVESKLAELEQA